MSQKKKLEGYNYCSLSVVESSQDYNNSNNRTENETFNPRRQ